MWFLSTNTTCQSTTQPFILCTIKIVYCQGDMFRLLLGHLQVLWEKQIQELCFNALWDPTMHWNIDSYWIYFLRGPEDDLMKVETCRPDNTIFIVYTGCNGRKGPDFGRVFLMLNYTEKPQNTYFQSWTVWEIMASEIWNFDSCYSLTDYQIRIETGRNMWFL